MSNLPSRIGKIVLASAFLVSLAQPVSAQAPSFVKSTITGVTLEAPTVLQFGPDDRLYVAERYGRIKILTVTRLAQGDYHATSVEVLEHIYGKPNRTDDGALDPTTLGHQLTGLVVTGTAANPVIYATSSDPRVAVAHDTGLDTNSGILTRLTWNGTEWDEIDLVRGLPRCEENHAPNDMVLDEENGIIYLGQGGNTNMGAPSNNFAFLPEYALSAAILTIDLNAIGDTTYDLPTLDDPSRPNSGPGGGDLNDPFGGNDGANQAVLTADGPVQVYASGMRNPFDVLIHSSGRIYTVDNGPNNGWGGFPTDCSNATREEGTATYGDGLHMIGTLGDGGGYYGGHPNPFRASRGVMINGQTPVPLGLENSVECQYLIPGLEDGALHVWSSSTNGIAEYTASNFGGAMQGDLLAVTWNNGDLERVQFDVDGNVLSVSTLFSNVGSLPLDVTAQSDDDYLPGTIWMTVLGGSKVVVFEPIDLVGCSAVYSLALDDDNDGYTNADESDNGTNPCSAADLPMDVDGDFLSDANDPDDDGDGVLDVSDAFALDDVDGLLTELPLLYGWAVGDPGTGLLGLGFTGMMFNGAETYLDQFVPENMTPGGASGKFTIDVVTSGDALEDQNDQENGFQLGVPVTSESGPTIFHTKLFAPFFGGVTPTAGQSFGFFIGTGDQDNYVKFVMDANGGAGGLRLLAEDDGTVTFDQVYPLPVLAAGVVDLQFTVVPALGTLEAAYQIDGGDWASVGPPLTMSGALLSAVQSPQAIALGLISTTGPTGAPFAATWDLIEAREAGTTAEARISLGPVASSIDASTYDSRSFEIRNDSPDGQSIVSAVFDLSTAIFPDMVFDPDGLAGDSAFKGFIPNSGSSATGYTSFAFEGPHDDGWDRVRVNFDDFGPGEEFTFSVDVDPTSIRGSNPPGPNESGSVSGLELAGSRITLQFDDGSFVHAETFRAPGSLSESNGQARYERPDAPSIEFVGHSGDNLTLGSSNQVARVTGPVGLDVRLLVIEAGLFVAGVPGGGFDIDSFESNSAVAVTEVAGTIGAGGSVDLPVLLTEQSVEAGLNLAAAVSVAPDGATSDLSNVVVADFEPVSLVAAPGALDFGLLPPDSVASMTAYVTNPGLSDVTITSAQIASPGDFSLTNTSPLPFVVSSGGADASFEISFAPSSPGGQTAVLEVHHDGIDSPLMILLDGDGAEPSGDVLYRVNCGGPEIPSGDGSLPAWGADSESSPSSYVNHSDSEVYVGSTFVDVPSWMPSSVPPELFVSERWDPSDPPEMSWNFPVAPGTEVEVRLFFGEIYPGITGAGQRIFNVSVEDDWIVGIDPYEEAGYASAFVRSIRVRVDDGNLDLDLLHDVENPAIKGIEVRKASPLVASRNTLSLSLGGIQELYVTVDPVHSGDLYLIGTGVSGVSPGFVLDGVFIPLNFDALVGTSIANAGFAPWIDTVGNVDSEGRAKGRFLMTPNGDPTLAGVVAHQAYVIVGSNGWVTFGSNAVPLTLVD